MIVRFPGSHRVVGEEQRREEAGRRSAGGTPIALALLAGGLFLALFADLSLGSVPIPIGDLVRSLLGSLPRHSVDDKIVLLFRLPKALTALLAGAALAVAGLQMQTIFRNPLAGPFVLGINSGASLGVALVVLIVGSGSGAAFIQGLGAAGQLGMVAAAAGGSAAVLLLVLSFSLRVRGVMTLLVLGLLFGYAVSAVVSILIEFSTADRIQSYIVWTFGSFGGVTWGELAVFAPVVVVGVAVSQTSAKQLNALLLGEHYAASMGLNVRRARVLTILLTALLAGTVTAFCGPIAFIGVAVPHLMRSLFSTSNHRLLLPAVALMGSIAALVADIVSSLPGSELVLPLNAVTALIGAPVVVWVILRRNNLRESFGS